MDSQEKHLEFIQSAIDRLASNSFSYKGWAVTLVTGLLALAAQQKSASLVLVALFPTSAFWLLDGYYLRRERCYRALYEAVRTMSPELWGRSKYSMNTQPYDENAGHWLSSLFAPTVALVYLPIIIVLVVLLAVVMPNG